VSVVIRKMGFSKTLNIQHSIKQHSGISCSLPLTGKF
jgi:hypothetical protein